MIIKAGGGDITLRDLIFQIFSSMQDPKAITAFLLLLIFAIIFGHIVWVIEREVNGPFHPRYGPGFIDGVWVRQDMHAKHTLVIRRMSDCKLGACRWPHSHAVPGFALAHDLQLVLQRLDYKVADFCGWRAALHGDGNNGWLWR